MSRFSNATEDTTLPLVLYIDNSFFVGCPNRKVKKSSVLIQSQTVKCPVSLGGTWTFPVSKSVFAPAIKSHMKVTPGGEENGEPTSIARAATWINLDWAVHQVRGRTWFDFVCRYGKPVGGEGEEGEEGEEEGGVRGERVPREICLANSQPTIDDNRVMRDGISTRPGARSVTAWLNV